jgi:hypothetical protein
MSKKVTGNLCISDIPENRIWESKKNGKKYISITLWQSDEPNQFGKTYSIHLTQLPEEEVRKDKKIYIANL